MDVSAGHTHTVKLVQVQLMPVQLRPRSGIRSGCSGDKLGTFVDQPKLPPLRCVNRTIWVANVSHTAERSLTRDLPCHAHHGCNIIEASSALGAPPLRFAQVNALIFSHACG
jgi:hypothetical protein